MTYLIWAAPCTLWASRLTTMRKGLIGPLALATSCLTLPAMAVVYPADVNAHLDAEIERFIGAPGFFEVDPAYFDSPEWNSVERFPFGDSPYTDYRDWGMSDAGKAIMALEAFEPALPHTRYRISVTHVDGNAEYPNVMRLVEVVRFNVGPALAASNRESYGDQFTPSAEDIGVGGDTAWRFAMFSSQGLPNQIAALSRRHLNQVDAQRYDCLGVPCLALVDPGDEGTNWTDITVDEDGDIEPYRKRDDRGLSVPTRVADLLSDQALSDEDLGMVISSDVIGQDTITNGVMWRADRQEWVKRWELAGLAARWSRAANFHPVASAEPDPGYLTAVSVATEVPAWQYALLFETNGQPTRRYDVLTNGEGASFRADGLDIVGVSDMPGWAYGHMPGIDAALKFYPTRGFPIDAPLLTSRVLDTGRREQMGRYVARELRLVASIPHASDGTHRVWTGPIWAIDDLPAAPGLPELPGSPFAGTALGLSMLQAYVGRELAELGMIARAEITLHLGLNSSDIDRLLLDDTDNTRMSLNSTASQMVRIRIGGLQAAPEGAFASTFADALLLGTGDWTGTLPPSTVPLLDN
ncbi:hypothetical protein [Devosia ginsengisoli]|uniref:hypothetical protein n=1 Tax=Devosia ginsengisoli TaxID=400770 RepID=UPI0026F31FC6|nr:hypothetical protein [Devosia ginsengisoli]MCR6670041.1 hypothetical protein [Devosia ginsengisoli]